MFPHDLACADWAFRFAAAHRAACCHLRARGKRARYLALLPYTDQH
jgi:hypothetical protein